jgi:hypothetical protein
MISYQQWRIIMAKGKSTGYKSKGERPNVAKDIRKTMRREYSNSSEQLLNKFTAFTKGKRVMITIPNPNKNDTKHRFMRIPMTRTQIKGES